MNDCWHIHLGSRISLVDLYIESNICLIPEVLYVKTSRFKFKLETIIGNLVECFVSI